MFCIVLYCCDLLVQGCKHNDWLKTQGAEKTKTKKKNNNNNAKKKKKKEEHAEEKPEQAVQNCGNETSVTAALPQNSFTVTRYRYPKRNIVILQPRTGNILKENTWLQFAHNNFVIE